jgi:hypothetical protein
VNVTVTQGVLTEVPKGYVVSNLDPTFNSTLNNQIYDPNFLPGFDVGLTNTSLSWSSGNGYGSLGYSVGPWAHEQVGLPHFAVGPQCCNFAEVPHTQQFRRVVWGDYYNVKAGFGPPGVNVENYTTNFSAPAYVGLRTDWNWSVQVSLDWKLPVLMNSDNERGAIGIAITQYVPGAPDNLYGWDRAEGCAAKSGGVPSCPNYWYGKRNNHGQYFSVPRRYSSGAWSPECSEPASGDLVCLPERRGLQLRMEHDSLVVQGDISTEQFRARYPVPTCN